MEENREEKIQNIAQDYEKVPSPPIPNQEEEKPKHTTSIPKRRNSIASLSVISHIHHRLGIEHPTGIRDIRYGRVLESDNFPFTIPRIKLTQEWNKIDSSWVEPNKCSMLIIFNNEGKGLTKIPTQEELLNISKRVVEIGVMTVNYTPTPPTPEEIKRYEIERKNKTSWDKLKEIEESKQGITKEEKKQEPIVEITPLLFIPPGEEHSFSFYDISLLYFRCKEGEANCTFSFYPN